MLVAPLAPAPVASPLVPEPAGQDFVPLLQPQPQAQPKAESFSSVWLLEISGNDSLGNPVLQTLSGNCIPSGTAFVSDPAWNAGLPGRAGRASPRWSVVTADPFSRLAGL